MANYNQVSYGSSDKETVTELQKLLNSKGNYGLEVDGIFGDQTKNAVLDFQKQSGLAEDGIVGEQTWNALSGNGNMGTASTGENTSAATETPTTNGGSSTYNDFNYGAFAPSDIVSQANALIQQHQANKPGAYTPVWQDEADAYLSQYQNRGPFSYDFNSDALYNQYKDNYIRQGQMAMMDTMGQAAAMTGGYGNSYAQGVGQQAYQQYLGQLNEVLPELYQMANDRYTQEGQELLSMYDLYSARDAQEYSQYQDALDRWNQEMSRLTSDYNTLYDREYGEYLDQRDMAYDEYLRDLENQQAAAELMASMGDYSRLGEVYGLTEEELAAIKKATTPKSTGSTGSKYKTLVYGSEEYNMIVDKIKSAKTLGELDSITSEMIYYGYNPSDIYNMTAFQDKKDALTPKTNPSFTGLPTGTLSVPTTAEAISNSIKNGLNSGGVTGLIGR